MSSIHASIDLSAKYDVRCFRRREKGLKRRGIWVMTKEHRGMFFHGDKDEFQGPHYSLTQLFQWTKLKDGEGLMQTDEISPAEVMAELSGWEWAEKEFVSILNRHKL